MITKEVFCKAIRAIQDYSDRLRRIDDTCDVYISDGPMAHIMDSFADFIVAALDLPEVDYIGNDVFYFCWELDFGRKWEPGAVKIDGVDFILDTPEQLWELIHYPYDEGKEEIKRKEEEND